MDGVQGSEPDQLQNLANQVDRGSYSFPALRCSPRDVLIIEVSSLQRCPRYRCPHYRGVFTTEVSSS